MAIVTTDNQHYTDIAAAIRSKNGTETLYKPSEMAAAIQAISGGGGGGDIGEGKYYCRVIDYDGTVLLEKRGNDGDTVTFPTLAAHDRLVFQGWSCSQEVVDNTVTFSGNNISVGAIYETASGKTEFDITLTRVTGLTVTFQNLTGVTEIDWGDGTTDNTLTHTYSDYNGYTILVSGVTRLGSYVFTQSSSSINYICTAARLGQSITSIESRAFQYCYSLTSITIPQSVTSIGIQEFDNCYSLTSVIIPQSVTRIRDSIFSNCYSLTSVIIPQGVRSIESMAFSSCYSLTSVVIPQGVTNIKTAAFQNCHSLVSVVIPQGVTTIAGFIFTACYSLTSVIIPQGVTSIGENIFSGCYSLTSVIIPQSVMSIESTAFRHCYSLIKYDFIAATSVPTLSTTDTFFKINAICQIIVPDSLYDEWIAATNWSTYADYIYKASEVAA